MRQFQVTRAYPRVKRQSLPIKPVDLAAALYAPLQTRFWLQVQVERHIWEQATGGKVKELGLYFTTPRVYLTLE